MKKQINLDVVQVALEHLIQKHGEATTLEVKNWLRTLDYEARQGEVSVHCAQAYHDNDKIQFRDNGTYRIYYFDENHNPVNQIQFDTEPKRDTPLSGYGINPPKEHNEALRDLDRLMSRLSTSTPKPTDEVSAYRNAIRGMRDDGGITWSSIPSAPIRDDVRNFEWNNEKDSDNYYATYKQPKRNKKFKCSSNHFPDMDVWAINAEKAREIYSEHYSIAPLGVRVRLV